MSATRAVWRTWWVYWNGPLSGEVDYRGARWWAQADHEDADGRMVAITLGNLGTVLNTLGRREEAAEHYRRALEAHEAAGNRPGARVLVLVGASHKAYFDAYLEPMQDVELVSVDAVLAGEN